VNNVEKGNHNYYATENEDRYQILSVTKLDALFVGVSNWKAKKNPV
jgi:neutral trehalase